MHLRIKLIILFGVALMINVSECQSGYNLERSDDVKSEWNSKTPCNTNSNMQGSVEREVTKNINGSLIRITKRAVVLPDNMKIGFNGSFPFNLTRTKRQIPSGPLPTNTLMGGTIGGSPPANGMPATNGMPASNGMPATNGMPVVSPAPAINTGVPAVFNQPAVTNLAIPAIPGVVSPVGGPGPVVFPPS